LIAIVRDAVWIGPGVEIAHWLFWQMTTHGGWKTPRR